MQFISVGSGFTTMTVDQSPVNDALGSRAVACLALINCQGQSTGNVFLLVFSGMSFLGRKSVASKCRPDLRNSQKNVWSILLIRGWLKVSVYWMLALLNCLDEFLLVRDATGRFNILRVTSTSITVRTIPAVWPSKWQLLHAARFCTVTPHFSRFSAKARVNNRTWEICGKVAAFQ